MTLWKPRHLGFSLVEMLVVLAIVGILALVGVNTIGDRRAAAVKGVMNEIEGVLLSAERNAVATGSNITLEASGQWADGTLKIDGRRTDPTDATKRLGSTAEVFSSQVKSNSRDHWSAGVDTGGGYASARGTAPLLDSIPPGNQEPLKSALGNNLCVGTKQTAVVDGLTKRFTTGFCIVVTALRNGQTVANGAVGVLVVPANTATILKFYKSEGDTQWRRI